MNYLNVVGSDKIKNTDIHDELMYCDMSLIEEQFQNNYQIIDDNLIATNNNNNTDSSSSSSCYSDCNYRHQKIPPSAIDLLINKLSDDKSYENGQELIENGLTNEIQNCIQQDFDETSNNSDLVVSIKQTKVGGKNQLPEEAIRIMNEWYDANENNPYPTVSERKLMAAEGNINENQVRAWFANKRNRNKLKIVRKKTENEKSIEIENKTKKVKRCRSKIKNNQIDILPTIDDNTISPSSSSLFSYSSASPNDQSQQEFDEWLINPCFENKIGDNLPTIKKNEFNSLTVLQEQQEIKQDFNQVNFNFDLDSVSFECNTPPPLLSSYSKTTNNNDFIINESNENLINQPINHNENFQYNLNNQIKIENDLVLAASQNSTFLNSDNVYYDYNYENHHQTSSLNTHQHQYQNDEIMSSFNLPNQIINQQFLQAASFLKFHQQQQQQQLKSTNIYDDINDFQSQNYFNNSLPIFNDNNIYNTTTDCCWQLYNRPFMPVTNHQNLYYQHQPEIIPNHHSVFTIQHQEQPQHQQPLLNNGYLNENNNLFTNENSQNQHFTNDRLERWSINSHPKLASTLLNKTPESINSKRIK
jgi:hypothetical protein